MARPKGRGEKTDLQIWKQGMTQTEIAKAIGYTRQGVSLIEIRALRKLRAAADEFHLREFLEIDHSSYRSRREEE